MIFVYYLLFILFISFPYILDQNNSKPSTNLLAIAVGIKQKEIVNQIVEKVTVSSLSALSTWWMFRTRYLTLFSNYFSSWQKDLLSCFFIMMVSWMNGMIYGGVAASSMSLPWIKQNGKSQMSFQGIHLQLVFHFQFLMWNIRVWKELLVAYRWFAKRFLHPDIAAEYDYIFLWDEDLGVENFDPERLVWSV